LKNSYEQIINILRARSKVEKNMNNNKPIFKCANNMKWQKTKRDGIWEKRLITPEDSPYQNVVLIKAEQGAEIELHQIHNSESIYVLEGTFEAILPDDTKRSLKTGEFCYFPSETSHGLYCTKGPGQYIVIFAPGEKINERKRQK